MRVKSQFKKQMEITVMVRVKSHLAQTLIAVKIIIKSHIRLRINQYYHSYSSIIITVSVKINQC